jgi:hypothetical protein
MIIDFRFRVPPFALKATEGKLGSEVQNLVRLV